MVHVTDTALDRLEVVRDENSLPEDQAIALVPSETGQLGFVAATPQPEDHVIERDGKTVLFIPATFVDAFDKLVVDFSETPEQTGFTVTQTT